MTPNLYQKSDVEKLYTPRREFIEAGIANQTKRYASEDKRKIALLIVDGQWDFVSPKGGLHVPGAVEDMQRLIEFLYRNLGDITSITASMDAHLPYHIFSAGWWVDKNGNHPGDYTPITYEDIRNGNWKPIIDPLWSTDYVKKLGLQAKKPLMIWPPHCLEGTPGQSLVPALSEAILYHSAARYAQPTYLTKGKNARTEHYGIFKAEIVDPNDINTQLKTEVLQTIADNDLIYVAGEAKSHCVLETMNQLVDNFDTQTIKKIRFLMDCTSSVQNPHIDFEALANTELDKMVNKGVVLVKSTDPIR